MLETLRAYGARLRAEAGEQDATAAALAGYALRTAEEAAGGVADQRRGRQLRPGGWMPRIPPRARFWPGPWSTTRRSGSGWQ